jgi:polar amino acid transport system substrate-binding protein
VWRRLSARVDRPFEAAFTGVYGDGPSTLYDRFVADVTVAAARERTRLDSAGVVAGTLVVGTELNYKPMEYIEGGKVKGFDIDLARKIARRLDVEVKFVNTSFDTLITQLAGGQFDAVFAGLSKTPEREEQVDFSDNYFVFQEAMAVGEDSDISSVSDLAGKRIAVQSGTTSEIYAQKNFTESEIVPFPTAEAMLTALRADQVDGVYLDQVVIAAAQEDGGIKTAFVIRTNPQDVAIAVQQGNDALRNAINEQLRAIIADGTYERLYREYIGPEVPPQFRAEAR